MHNKKANNKRWRNFIYPKKPKGILYTYRKVLGLLLLLLLFSLPFIQYKGEQLVLLNFLERKFVFFGLWFAPQDFYLFAFAMLIGMLFIVCFTVVLGRLWCGWACPQTIFMEMVFRQIEYWIEGDANKQQKLDAQAWNLEKVLKKGIKHFLYLCISFAIANTFLAYIIGSDKLYEIITDPVTQHWSGFLALCIFTLIFYGVFTYVREVVCTVICPYGRLQGVLLDGKSLIVAYDEQRGEPRGKIQKMDTSSPKGDCVDCGLCVQVCPTGIDIRKGLQLECVQCTACIDACDAVMDKLHKPKRLIGFYNQDYLKNREPFKLGMRAYGYALVLILVIAVFASLIYNRAAVGATILKASGTLYQEREQGKVSNLYNAELFNKIPHDITFVIRSTNPAHQIELIQKTEVIPKGKSTQFAFFLLRDRKEIKSYKSEITVEILDPDGNRLGKSKTSFFAPTKK